MNNYFKNAIVSDAIAILVALVAALIFVLVPTDAKELNGEDLILTKINSIRAENGLTTLVKSKGLDTAATKRANEITTCYSHTRPDGSEYWTVDSSLVYGENLAQGYSEQEVVDAWMASPTHKDNILFGDFKTCAIATVMVNNVPYIALEFGY